VFVCACVCKGQIIASLKIMTTTGIYDQSHFSCNVSRSGLDEEIA